MSDVRTLSLLGQDYSFRIPAEEYALFLEAAERLKDEVAQAQQRYGSSGHQNLLVAAALSLAVTLSQQTKSHAQGEQRLKQLIDRLLEQREG